MKPLGEQRLHFLRSLRVGIHRRLPIHRAATRRLGCVSGPMRWERGEDGGEADIVEDDTPWYRRKTKRRQERCRIPGCTLMRCTAEAKRAST